MITSMNDEAPFVLATANATLRTLPDDFRDHKNAAANALGWLNDYADQDGLDDTVIDSLAGQVIAIALHARARALQRRADLTEGGNGI
jgi:chorismate-pyruvate lyase